MSDWQMIVVTILVPLLITYGIPFASEKMKARQAERVSDADASAKFRDQLMKRIDQLEGAVKECEEDRDRLHREMGVLRDEFLGFKELVRARTPDSLRRDIIDEAAG